MIKYIFNEVKIHASEMWIFTIKNPAPIDHLLKRN